MVAAADYSSADSEKIKADLPPLIMAAGDLLEKAISAADELEMEIEEDDPAEASEASDEA